MWYTNKYNFGEKSHVWTSWRGCFQVSGARRDCYINSYRIKGRDRYYNIIMKREYQTADNLLITALETPKMSKLFQKYDVIMVMVGGSHLAGLADEESDYDLNFFVADNCDYYRCVDDWHLQICGKTVHAYICPLKAIEYSYIGYAASLIKQTKLTKASLAWTNPRYSGFISKWLELAPQLGYIGMLKYREYLKAAAEIWKHSYSYLLGADWLLNTDYGVEAATYWKQNYLNLSTEQSKYYSKAFDQISSILDQTGDNWKDLWLPIYEMLKTML